MTTLKVAQRFVVVTGASSGLGLEMATQLAQVHKANLVLVARRVERLNALKEQLEKTGVQVVTVAADVSVTADCERIFREATDGREIHGVILNAGVTFFGRLLEQPPQNVLSLVNTNVTGLALLTRLFAPYLVERGQQGALMLVSSLGGSTPMPFQAVYGACKAFVTSLGCALASELKGTGVSVTVFAPGGISTEMSESSGLAAHFGKGNPAVMDAAACARLALRAFFRRELVCVPGVLNRLGGFFMKLLPRAWVTWIMRQQFQRAFP